MKFYTDLALERIQAPQKVYRHPEGVRRFLQKDGADTFVTVASDQNPLYSHSVQNAVRGALQKTWCDFTCSARRILVVGLGNRNLTCDALGVNVAERIMTGSVRERTVFSFCPNVFGVTNIETSTLVKAVTAQISPDLVVLVDALCSRDGKRICSCFEFSTCGIRAGSGVGSHSSPMNERTLGVPCLAVGVPTVARAGSILRSVLDSTANGHDLNRLNKPEKELCAMLVSPKEIDILSAICVRLLVDSFHQALLN